MINIITMAGKGKRFSEKGYNLPKPLISIFGEPMIWRVIDCLPEAKKWIFVVRQDHIDNFSIDKIIKDKIPDAIITVDKDLLGGASIFCAEPHIPDGEDILIAGCDMGFVYDKGKFEKLKNSCDCILWTFTNDKRISDSPTSWGYTILKEDVNTIKDISVKIPISSNPIRDHAIAATFWVKSKELLYKSIKIMIDKDIKTNNEYYLDNLPIALNILGKRSCIFDIDLLVGWGTPEELDSFKEIYKNYMEKNLDSLSLSEKEKKLWEIYFKKWPIRQN